jgi:hypothetical protein
MQHFEPSCGRAHSLRYGQDPELLVRLRLAHTLRLVGDPDGSEHQHDLAVAAADESTHVYSRAVLSVWAAILALDRGDVDQLQRQVRALDADMSDDVPDHFRLMAGAFAGHLVCSRVASSRNSSGCQVREQLIAGEARAPGQPGIATRILLEDYALAGEARTEAEIEAELRRALEVARGRGARRFEQRIQGTLRGTPAQSRSRHLTSD